MSGLWTKEKKRRKWTRRMALSAYGMSESYQDAFRKAETRAGCVGAVGMAITIGFFGYFWGLAPALLGIYVGIFIALLMMMLTTEWQLEPLDAWWENVEYEGASLYLRERIDEYRGSTSTTIKENKK